jgi:hypothetical protein
VESAGGGPTAPEVAAARPRRLARDLTILGLVGALLLAALGAGAAATYRELYSPRAFVLHYLELLEDRRAAEALAVPGVAVDSAELEAAGLPATASEALLRSDALQGIGDTRVVEEVTDGDVTRVTVAYRAAAYDGRTTFVVRQDGWIGVAPRWRFDVSPLAVVDLTVRGSMRFSVNGFEVDKRQVSVDGVDADPSAAVPLLVFSPGLYSVAVDTAISATPGVAILADAPLTGVPVDVQAEPTEEFVSVVQQRVEDFLTSCAEQEVLQPTGCPFGFTVRNRIDDAPTWSIVQQPTVSVVPDGAGWRIPSAKAVARIEVDVRSIFDGSVRTVEEDVPFTVDGEISVQPDGSASITVGGRTD